MIKCDVQVTVHRDTFFGIRNSEPSRSCSQAGSKTVWHIPLLCVQWKISGDGQRNCPKHVEFYSKNNFEKVMHLVGFIIWIFLIRICSTYFVLSIMCRLHLHEIVGDVMFPAVSLYQKATLQTRNVIPTQTAEEDTTLRLHVLNLLPRHINPKLLTTDKRKSWRTYRQQYIWRHNVRFSYNCIECGLFTFSDVMFAWKLIGYHVSAEWFVSEAQLVLQFQSQFCDRKK